jgi:hypothetical protein
MINLLQSNYLTNDNHIWDVSNLTFSPKYKMILLMLNIQNYPDTIYYEQNFLRQIILKVFINLNYS